MLHEPTYALSGRAAACPHRPSRPPRHARLARPTIGEDRVHLEQRAEGELQELGRQNSSTSSDSIGDDAGVLRQDDGAQDAAPRSQITSVKVSKDSVSSSAQQPESGALRFRSVPLLCLGVRFASDLSRSYSIAKLRGGSGVSSPYVRVRVYLRVSLECIFARRYTLLMTIAKCGT